MFCSIIIPTVGRSSLSNSVESVLKQNFAAHDYEIIVVNDSGQPLTPANWQESNRVQILNTQKRERCFARNTGAAIAKGDYFLFLDDDDWLFPEALNHFGSLAQQFPGTAWLYGGVKFVDNAEKPLGFLNQGKTGNCFVEVMTETWIPIQASLIKADVFFQAGGFNPEFVGAEDLELLRQIALRHDLVHTPEDTTCIKRG
jgi:glycosyltransferase involved in cell wall biosynthesis